MTTEQPQTPPPATPPATPPPQPATQPDQTTDEAEGFTVINPPMATYVPENRLAKLRGIILGRAVHPSTQSAFYIVQLTEPCDDIIHYDADEDGAPAGTLVAVWETIELMAMHSFAPRFAMHASLRNEVCQMAWEVRLKPWENLTSSAQRILCKARQLTEAKDLQSVHRPPPFPVPEIIMSREELGFEPSHPSEAGTIPMELSILAYVQKALTNLTDEQADKVMAIADTFKDAQAPAATKEPAGSE